LSQFTAAAQDVARLVRYVERGKDDGDSIRDYSLALQPRDVERIVEDVLAPTGDDEPVLPWGLVCPACHQPVAQVERTGPSSLALQCPACGHRWGAERPKRTEETP
jgi:hypothetical protein